MDQRVKCVYGSKGRHLVFGVCVCVRVDLSADISDNAGEQWYNSSFPDFHQKEWLVKNEKRKSA